MNYSTYQEFRRYLREHYSTAANDVNLALYPIDLKFYILVLHTPITNLEAGCSRLPHHLCEGK